VLRTFTIQKANQTIDFGALGGKTLGDADFNVAATASSGLPVSFAAAGSCTVSGNTVHIVAVNLCTITASQPGNNDYNAAADVSRSFLIFWPFVGFFSPINNQPTMNFAQGGSTVPTKFTLGGNRGLDIFASGSPASVRIDCVTGTPIGALTPTLLPGRSGLTYDSGLYHYNWKTDRAWAGTCRELRVILSDGSTRTAQFSFRA
jgi:hypothetical protein